VPKRKPLAEVRIGDSVVKVYDKEVLDMVLSKYHSSTSKSQSSTVIVPEGTINLNEFCKGLTMKECVEKIRREIPNYREKIYSISINLED